MEPQNCLQQSAGHKGFFSRMMQKGRPQHCDGGPGAERTFLGSAGVSMFFTGVGENAEGSGHCTAPPTSSAANPKP